MLYQVKWVSGRGRYTTHTFRTRAVAEACAARHMKYTGRPARVVEVKGSRTYETGEIKVEPRTLRGKRLYYVAVFYNMPVHFGVGQTPLDAIRDLLDSERVHRD